MEFQQTPFLAIRNSPKVKSLVSNLYTAAMPAKYTNPNDGTFPQQSMTREPTIQAVLNPSTLTAGMSGATDLGTAIAVLASTKNQVVNYLVAQPVFRYNEISQNTQEINLMAIPNLMLAISFEKLFLPLSLLTTNTLNRIRANDGLKFVKLTSGNEAGKHMLDVSAFPSETTLMATDFLQAYANWLVVIKSTCDEETARGWYKHYDRMIANPEFVCWFPAWFKMDKALRVQWSSPQLAIPNVSSMLYLFSIESHKNCQGRPAFHGDTINAFRNAMHASHDIPRISTSSSQQRRHSDSPV